MSAGPVPPHPTRIAIAGGGYALELDPAEGGSIARLQWSGRDLLRPRQGPGVLASACFPLVPFCNRIAAGRFGFGGRSISLAPNHPAAPHEPVLHGFGWLREWTLLEHESTRVRLAFVHEAGEWPWRFSAEQEFVLGDAGAELRLSAVNLAGEPMPIGLGFHPNFPRSPGTVYSGRHRAERQPGGELAWRSAPIDWWGGAEVGRRLVDTTYAAREGPLTIEHPAEHPPITLFPSADLPFTHVYVPRGADYFCVEPVSHLPDAFRTLEPARGMRVLQPGERWTVSLRIAAGRPAAV